MLNARLTLVVGKGGVGKTTVAMAAAMRAAHHHAPVLVVSTDPAHSLGDVLGMPVGAEPEPVAPHLWALQIDPARTFAAFLHDIRAPLHAALDRGTYLDGADIEALIGLPLPGIDEVTALLELSRLLTDSRWQHIVVDTAPTGHTERLLRLPEAFAAFTDLLDAMQVRHRYLVARLGRGMRRSGADPVEHFLTDLHEQSRSIQEHLFDHAHTAIWLVGAPAPMVLDETVRYLGWLHQRALPLTAVVLNRIDARSGAGPNASLRQALDRLLSDAPRVPAYVVPEFRRAPRGLVRLRHFGECLARGGTPQLGRPLGQGGVKPTPTSGGRGIHFPLSSLGLQFVVGKGGVGKTTIAATTAFALARADHPVLLLSLDPAHSLGDIWGKSIGDEPVLVAAGLWALEVDAVARWQAQRELWQAALGDAAEEAANGALPGWRDTLQDIEHLLDLVPPGVDEVVGLFVLADLWERSDYRAIIADCAPTGHLLQLLKLPELALEWVHMCMRLIIKYREVVALQRLAKELLGMSRQLKRVSALLRDPSGCGFIPVTLPEALSLAETERLVASLEAAGMPIATLVLNKFEPEAGRHGHARAAEHARIAASLVVTYRYPITRVMNGDPGLLGVDTFEAAAS